MVKSDRGIAFRHRGAFGAVQSCKFNNVQRSFHALSFEPNLELVIVGRKGVI
jgi:hypothetical protein